MNYEVTAKPSLRQLKNIKSEVITNTEEKTNTAVSKTLITITALILVAATGLLSYSFFRQEEYDFSWLMTISAYASIVMGIYGIYWLSSQKTQSEGKKTIAH